MFIFTLIMENYKSYIIQIKGKNTAEQAVKLLEKDSMLRAFRRESYSIIDPKEKLVEVALSKSESCENIKRKAKLNHKKLKYKFFNLGEIDQNITNDQLTFIIENLSKRYYIDKEEGIEILSYMDSFFSEYYKWGENYRPLWLKFVSDLYEEEFPEKNKVTLYGIKLIALSENYSNKIVDYGFELIKQAINDNVLNVKLKQLKAKQNIKSFNLF